MIIQKIDGKELEISEGSHVYFKDENGEDVYKDWLELGYDINSKLAELVNEMDEILKKGAELIEDLG